MEEFYSEVISLLKERKISKLELSKIKTKLSHKYGMKKIPTDIDILLHATSDDLKTLSIITKPTRTISGVATIALMSAPISCPHGTCTFCPGGPGSVFGDTPQSYTGKEPSTMRAIRAGFDPYLITFNRLEQYCVTGHNFEKVEIIIQGGTFPSFDINYQDNFIKYTFRALNDFSGMFFSEGVFDVDKFRQFFELPGDVRDIERTLRIQSKIRQIKSKDVSLETEQVKNQNSVARCVALCIETKPDFSRQNQINQMLRLGTTRVELGVQSLDDSILTAVNRGHLMQDTYDSAALLKDSFLKVGFHLMPGLPGSSKEKDIEMFKAVFEDERLRPDNLKIYPCMVMPGTVLFEDFKAGRFNPVTTKEAAIIIAEGKRFIPTYCRVMRVQRDIPTYVTSAGVDRTNLRQYVDIIKAERKIVCRCIRCREPMLKVPSSPAQILVDEYDSSGGKEFFISAVSDDMLLGFCRLRFPAKPFRVEITPDSAGIRELHVFGPAAGLGEQGSVQHKGLGKSLLLKAEQIARANGKRKLLVISGVGAREYYRKLNFVSDGPYMSKDLR